MAKCRNGDCTGGLECPENAVPRGRCVEYLIAWDDKTWSTETRAVYESVEADILRMYGGTGYRSAALITLYNNDPCQDAEPGHVHAV